ncbi:MAG: ferredoxin [Lentisphaeria bacterium]|nr:ferredoxin [Lentisphaeria bacterium]
MKLRVDRETCTGCGLCAEICPAVFEMGDDDLARVKGNAVPADAEADCREAVESCPVEAIRIEE